MVNSRNKGANFERKISKLLEDSLGISFVRTPQSGAFSTNTKDTRLSGDLYSPDLDFPFVIECKNYEDYNIEDLINGSKGDVVKWVEQLEKEKGKKLGLLIFKRNYGKIFCMIENIEFYPSFKWKQYYIGLLENALPNLRRYINEYTSNRLN